MSEDSPRWPGSQGGAGLDFSPYRKPKDDDGSFKSASDEGRPSTAGKDDTAAKAAPAPERAATDPVSAQSPSSTRITPGAAARAADTAKAWAATPIGATAGTAAESTNAPATSQPTPARAATDPVDVTPAKQPTVEIGRRTKGSVSSRRTRKARLRLSRIDPWSVMKTTFLFSIAFGVMMCAITFVLWTVLSGSGALDSVNELVNRVVGDENNQFNIGTYLDIRRVMGFTLTIAFIDVLIITAVSTLFAFLYNLSAIVLGGLEVTLAED